ncbi:hypothetical protein [Pseudoxanthobacter sp.]|uniref:hypothetical protein n=1 Tax=Pseudoxanthobacter sp. TaxID=1925742 RepID=UPI002FDFEA86
MRFVVPLLYIAAAGLWLWGLHDVVALATNGVWVSGIPKIDILSAGVIKLIAGALICALAVRLSRQS